MSQNTSQKLGTLSLTMIVISLVIGMGIFKTPATIAAKAGIESIFFSAWIIGGLIALIGALVYAELGTRLPSIGGYYQILATCFHPSVGFTVNVLILISNAASIAVVALIGSDYISDFLFGMPSNDWFNIVAATLPIALFYGVNMLGLKTSSSTQNLLMLLKIGLIVLLISSLFTQIHIAPHGHNLQAKVYEYDGHNTLLLLMVSSISVFFTYGGYQQTINFGGETKTNTTLPKAIIVGILVVIVLYLSINYAYIQVVGFSNMKNATAIGALLCETWFGKAGGKIFDLAMFLSVLAYVNVSLLSNPRVMYAMSMDHVFPKIFSKIHPTTQALVPGLTLFALSAIVITFFGKGVDNVLSFSIFLDCFGFVASAATLYVLRNRKMNEKMVHPIISKITPYLAAVFILAYILLSIAVFIDNPIAAIIGLVLLMVFAGVYFLVYQKK